MTSNVHDTTSLSRFFHRNSEPWINEQTDQGTAFSQKTKTYPQAVRVALPETTPTGLDRIAAARRSERAFSNTTLPLTSFASLLRSAYAALGPDVMENGQKFLRRPVPSAGGLYPLEIYALVRNVEGLAKGVYHYDSIGDALEIIEQGPWENKAEEAFHTWAFVKHAPMIICVGAVFERSQSKYGPRGYRYILLEAGHVVQNLCLSAHDLGLTSLCMGGYQDSVLNRVVGLDGEEEAIVYTIALGQSDDL